MKLHKISLAGFLAGIFWIGISTIRWFFIYPDMSQWLLSMLIGSIIIGMSYIYNWMREMDGRMDAVANKTGSMLSFIFKDSTMLEKDE